MRKIWSNATESSGFIRNACAEYRTEMEYGYGELGTNLKRVTVLIQAGGPARIYYVSFGSFEQVGFLTQRVEESNHADTSGGVITLNPN